MEEILDICVWNKVSKDQVCSQVPRRVMQSAIFVVDLEKVDIRDVTVDDVGMYETHSSPSQKVWVLDREPDSAEEDELESSRPYTLQKRNASEDADEFVVRRYYSWQSSGLKRTIVKVFHKKAPLRNAIIQYKFDKKHKSMPRASGHGNNKAKESYYRTKPSVLSKIRDMGRQQKRPKEIVEDIQSEAGGAIGVNSPSEIPRDRRQVYNLLHRVPFRLKSRNTGKPKTPEFAKLLSIMHTSKFLRDVSFHVKSEKEHKTTPNTFACTDYQLHWMKTFCKGSQPKAQVGIDMTYNVGPYFLTALTFGHPMFVQKGTDRHPTIFLGMSTSCTRTTSDYQYLAANLAKEQITSLTYGTDGEFALERGFENVYPIEGVHVERNIHLRCFEHLKVDLKMQMKQLGIKEQKQQEIVCKILGSEFEGKRRLGLVDCQESEFDENLRRLETELPQQLVVWMRSKKGRIRPFTEALKKCALKSVRTAAGLGNPPNKYSNQRSESFNSVLKEVAGRTQVDQVHIHEVTEERVVNAQSEELVKAIYGMGEYRLDSQYRHLQVDQLQWFEMEPHQRQAFADKVLLYNDPCRNFILEVPDLDIPTVSNKALCDMWKRASVLVSKEQSHYLQNGCYCVTDQKNSYIVEQSSTMCFKCKCQAFEANKLLCEHIVLVCLKTDKLERYLNKIAKQGNKPVQIMCAELPRGRGMKPGQKRRGKNNVEKAPIVSVAQGGKAAVVNVPNSAEAEGEINPGTDITCSKPAIYEHFYQNDNAFNIVFIKDHPSATTCISCGNAIPHKDSSVFKPYDIIFMHMERYQYPVRDDNGKVVEMRTTRKKLAKRFYCLKKECILKRHPYFWIGRIRVTAAIKERLHASHLQLLSRTLQGYIP